MTLIPEASPTPDTRTIHQRMAAVLEELPAIGKNQRNKEQGFDFRGIDDVLPALTPLLAKHGVFFVPDVLERVVDRRTTRNGTVMYEVNLHVRYTFYGLLGDSVVASGWGEGTDMGDKATNKAMTGAMKYVLFQAFAISTKEAAQSDSDRHSPEETVERVDWHVANGWDGGVDEHDDRLRSLKASLAALPDSAKAAFKAWREGAGIDLRNALTLDEMVQCEDQALELAGGAGAQTTPEPPAPPQGEDTGAIQPSSEESPDEPCALCGSHRTQRVVVEGVVRCSKAKECEERARLAQNEMALDG